MSPERDQIVRYIRKQAKDYGQKAKHANTARKSFKYIHCRDALRGVARAIVKNANKESATCAPSATEDSVRQTAESSGRTRLRARHQNNLRFIKAHLDNSTCK